MDLSVVIVSYNVKYYLQQCLYSLEKALAGIDSEVIVFDNHSKDGTIEYLSDKFPRVSFISSCHNRGFARANNIAIKQSHGKYILLLNPDTIVCEETINEALSFMEKHPQAGAAGVRMKKTDGSDAMESRRGIPTPLTAFFKISGLCSRCPHNHRLGKYYMGWLPWDKASQIDVVSGAFCLLRRKALDEIGLLDEDFFMYGEDIDLSYRLKKKGWENWYLPLRILHYKGESTERSSFRYVHVFYEAMLIFFRKHYSHLSVILTIPIKIAIYGRATLSLISMLMHKAYKGLGFISNDKSVDSLYIFYIRPENMKRCQQLANRRGLWAEFHDANKKMKESLSLGVKYKKAYITYDATAYTYEEMLERMESNQHAGLTLGIYYPEQEMVITDSDVVID